MITFDKAVIKRLQRLESLIELDEDALSRLDSFKNNLDTVTNELKQYMAEVYDARLVLLEEKVQNLIDKNFLKE